MNLPEFLTRKDIARIALCNAKDVERNEEDWGLKPFRKDLNLRVLRYEPTIGTLKALVQKGIVHSMEQAVYRLFH